MTGFCRPDIPMGHEWLIRVGLSRSAEIGGPLPTGENQTFDLGATIPNSNAPQLRATAPGDYFGLRPFVTLPPMLPSRHNKNGFPGLGR